MAPVPEGADGEQRREVNQFVMSEDQLSRLLNSRQDRDASEGHLVSLVESLKAPRAVRMEFKQLSGKYPGLIGHDLDRILSHGRQLGFKDEYTLVQIPNFLDANAHAVYSRLSETTIRSYNLLRTAMIDELNPAESLQDKEDGLTMVRMEECGQFVSQEALDDWKLKIRGLTAAAYPHKKMDEIETLAARHFVNGLRSPLDHQVRCQLSVDRSWRTVVATAEKIIYSESRSKKKATTEISNRVSDNRPIDKLDTLQLKVEKLTEVVEKLGIGEHHRANRVENWNSNDRKPSEDRRGREGHDRRDDWKEKQTWRSRGDSPKPWNKDERRSSTSPNQGGSRNNWGGNNRSPSPGFRRPYSPGYDSRNPRYEGRNNSPGRFEARKNSPGRYSAEEYKKYKEFLEFKEFQDFQTTNRGLQK